MTEPERTYHPPLRPISPIRSLPERSPPRRQQSRGRIRPTNRSAGTENISSTKIAENTNIRPVNRRVADDHTIPSSLPNQLRRPLVPSMFHKLPENEGGPVGKVYAEMMWQGPYSQWDLVRIETPLDGSCLFHAIANSFSPSYRVQKIDDVGMSRDQIIAKLRKELSETLAQPISKDKETTHYELLNGGNTANFAEGVPEYALSYMQRQLDSTQPIGYGYMEFIGNVLNKDIYILEAIRHDVYVTDELPYTIQGNRCSIVLYYMNGHYELVGIRRQNEHNGSEIAFDTHFAPNHSFIRFLYGRVRAVTG